MGTFDWNAVISAFGSLAGFAIVGKWLLKSAEKSNETLPTLIESLKTVNESIKATNVSMQELFESRNEHALELKEIKMIHKLKGCDLPQTK